MPKRPHECLARQYGDQMICAACGLNWDTNDPEPPECRKVDRRTKKAKAYHANAREGIKGRVAGMQAAWRVFLDTVEV